MNLRVHIILAISPLPQLIHEAEKAMLHSKSSVPQSADIPKMDFSKACRHQTKITGALLMFQKLCDKIISYLEV